MKAIALRLLRSTVSTVIGALLAKYANDPRFILAAPALQGLGKLIRLKWPGLAQKLGGLGVPF